MANIYIAPFSSEITFVKLGIPLLNSFSEFDVRLQTVLSDFVSKKPQGRKIAYVNHFAVSTENEVIYLTAVQSQWK